MKKLLIIGLIAGAAFGGMKLQEAAKKNGGMKPTSRKARRKVKRKAREARKAARVAFRKATDASTAVASKALGNPSLDSSGYTNATSSTAAKSAS